MIHTNVRRVRLAKGIKLAFLAKKLKKTRQQYSNKEAGRSGIEVEELVVIAKALGESPAIFFDDSLTDSVIERLEGGN